MAERALATAFVNIVPGTVELEKYLKGKLSSDMENAGKDLGKKLSAGLSQGFKNAGAAMSKVGTQLSIGVTAPLAAIGVKAIQSSADFGVAMASLQVNSGASAASMEKMRDLAIKMGQDTVFSAGEAANAMLELSKGGMDPAVISGGALESTMALAATEGMSLAESATIVTQAMNTFGLSADESMKAVDILAAGAVASTASVYDLAGALKFVGSSAATLGVPMSDTVTAIAALNNAGIDSTTAGTSLNRMLLGLIPTTEKGQKAMDDLGISFLNQDGSIKSLAEVVGILETQMAGLSDSERITALKNMFGVEGMRAATILLEQGSKGFKDLNDQVETAGVASELSNARMSGLAGAIEQMKGSIDTAFLAVGDRLTPATMAISNFITNLVNGFASLSPRTQEVIVTIAAVVAAIGPMLIFIGKVTQAIGFLIPVFAKLPAIFTAVKTAMVAFNLVLAANPIGALITAIGLLVAGLIYFFTQTETGKKAWAAFTQFLGDAWKNFSQFFVTLGQNIADGWKKTVNGLGEIWQRIKEMFNAAVQFITKIFMDWTIYGLIIKNWNNILSFFRGLWDNIIGFFRNALNFVVRLFMDWTVYGLIIKNWDKIMSFFRNLPKQFVEFGRNIIQGLLDGAGQLLPKIGEFFLSKIPGWIREPFKKALGIASPSKVFKEFGKNIIQGLVKGLMGGESSIKSTMKNVSDKVAELYKNGDISKAAKKQADNLIKVYQKQLIVLDRELQKVNKRLEDAQRELEDRIQERQNFIDQIAKQYGSKLTLNEESTAGNVAEDLRKRIEMTRKLTTLTKDLTAMGLDKSIIRDIVEAQAVDFAESVFAGGQAAVDELNVLASEANSAALELATSVGDTLFNEGIEFAQGIVDELKKKQSDLETLMKEVAQAFSTELKGLIKGALSEGAPVMDTGKKDLGKKDDKKKDDSKKDDKKILDDTSKKLTGVFQSVAKNLPKGGASGGGGGGSIKFRAMATGGFVTGPTTALIGEAGPEVVYPLKDFERVMGLNERGSSKTIVYNAAPNQSLDSEQALFQAMKRAKVISGW